MSDTSDNTVRRRQAVAKKMAESIKRLREASRTVEEETDVISRLSRLEGECDNALRLLGPIHESVTEGVEGFEGLTQCDPLRPDGWVAWHSEMDIQIYYRFDWGFDPPATIHVAKTGLDTTRFKKTDTEAANTYLKAITGTTK